MKIQVYSSQLVTKHNPNGRGYADTETQEGRDLIGPGIVFIEEEKKIQNKMRKIAKDEIAKDEAAK